MIYFLLTLVVSLLVATVAHHDKNETIATIVAQDTNETTSSAFDMHDGLAPTEIHEHHRMSFGLTVVGLLVVIAGGGAFAWYRSKRANYEQVSTEVVV